MPRQRLIITIDGPAGTGKSTVAHDLAARLGLEFLDTGAMYRAATLLALRRGIDPADGPALAAALRDADMHFDWNTDPPAILLDDEDVSDAIRDMSISEHVSIVAGRPEVREALVAQQRDIAAGHPFLVSEGRDQGSIVFPDADVRFYLDAGPVVRARRRFDQLEAAGKSITYDAVLRDVENRDRLDSTRAVAPLIQPQGAVVVDTDELTLHEVVDCLEAIVRKEIGDIDTLPRSACINRESR